MKTKHAFLAITTVAAAAAVVVLNVALREAHKTRRVPSIKTASTVESLLNVHGSKRQSFMICGRSFISPKGAPPYYLALPDGLGILFAYELSVTDTRLVYCDTNKCEFVEATLQHTIFGNQIGYWQATGGKMGDVVESVASNRVYLLSKGFNYSERSVFDLKTGTFLVTDRDGQFTKSYLQMPTIPQQPNEH